MPAPRSLNAGYHRCAPAINCIAGLLWRSALTVDLLLSFVAFFSTLPANEPQRCRICRF
ncbi:hypothetical protein N015_10605 [Pseudomonas asturiensis]|uniref:Uncharacterized protein n=1 Tax=Pseudomonas asturiensis TaxID=1190415 RepID=A0ABX6HBD6_9PSED|nr:hypothetical protein N015_10605 [Pseudomonas asturiensis]